MENEVRLSDFVGHERALKFAAHNIRAEAARRLLNGDGVPAYLVCSVMDWIELFNSKEGTIVSGSKNMPMHCLVRTAAGDIAVFPDSRGWGKNGVCK